MGMCLKQLPIVFFMTLLYTFFYSYAAAAEPVVIGNVDYVRGVVSAKAASGGGRLLGQKGEPIYETDSIVTGNTSFAVLVFQDGTKVTVRPKSVFVISEYQFKRSSGNKAFFRLLKGGVRTVTGAINDNNSENITLETPSTHVKVSERNTDVVMRSCDGDCDEGLSNNTANSVARIALAKGGVYVSDATGKRAVKTGDTVKAQDTLLTGNNAFAVLVFVDKTRVTLESLTTFKISEFVYPKGRPKQGNVLFNLVTGGARTLTGLIGKANPQKFKLKTLVATMGIRGTGFDTYYDNRTYVNVWQGAVTATRNGRTQNIDLNQTLSVGKDGFKRLERFPDRIQSKFRQNLRPDRVNTQSTFMSVKSGNVRVTDASNNQNSQQQKSTTDIRLSAGESAVSNRVRSKKVTNVPSVINNDSYTSVAPKRIQSSFQKKLNKTTNQGQEQGKGLEQNQGQSNRKDNQGQGQGEQKNNRSDGFGESDGVRGSEGLRGSNDFGGFDDFDGRSNNQRNMGQQGGGNQGPRPAGRP